MSQQQFSIILDSLLSLVSVDNNAKELYCHKLLSDADDALGGSLSNQTRAGLSQMVEAWQATSPDEPNTSAVDAFLQDLQSESRLNQISQRPF